MRLAQAIQTLSHRNLRDRPIYSKSDLAKCFPDESANTFNQSLRRLTEAGVLQRVASGVYRNATQPVPLGILEHIGRALRRGHYSYVSLESALSEYGVISQIPMRLTVMTTGRKGVFHTSFGTIEFVHTKKSPKACFDGSIDADRPFRLAKKMTAFQDLKRVGRNLHLVDEEILREAS